MTDLDRAIAHAAAVLGLSHDVALLLPVRVVRDLWAEKVRTEQQEREEARDLSQPPVTRLRTDEDIRERLRVKAKTNEAQRRGREDGSTQDEFANLGRPEAVAGSEASRAHQDADGNDGR